MGLLLKSVNERIVELGGVLDAFRFPEVGVVLLLDNPAATLGFFVRVGGILGGLCSTSLSLNLAFCASIRAVQHDIHNILSCKQFPCAGTLHAWQCEEVCVLGSGQALWLQGRGGGWQT